MRDCARSLYEVGCVVVLMGFVVLYCYAPLEGGILSVLCGVLVVLGVCGGVCGEAVGGRSLEGCGGCWECVGLC